MSRSETARDVAKVLQGTHLIRIIRIPGREYDLVNRLLEDKHLLEDADPGASLVNRRFSLHPGYFLELTMYNSKNDEEEPVFHMNLMGRDTVSNPNEEWLVESYAVTDRIPDVVEFEETPKDGKRFMVRIRRTDSGTRGK